MQHATPPLIARFFYAVIVPCLASGVAAADEKVTQVTLFRLPSVVSSFGEAKGFQFTPMSEDQVSIDELEKKLKACEAENQLRKDKKKAANSLAIVELGGITSSVKVPDIFTIFGDGAEIRFLTTDARVTWYPFSTTKSEVGTASLPSPALMSAEAAPAAMAIDSQRLAIDLAEKLGSTKGQTKELLINLLDELKSAGKDASKLEQVINRLKTSLNETAPTSLQQEVPATPGNTDCSGQTASGFRLLCVSGANATNLTYQQPSVPWAFEYWIDETTKTIHAFAKITNLTSYPWDKDTIVVLRDTPDSTAFLRFSLGDPLLADHSGVFPVGSYQYSDERRVLDIDQSPLQVVRTVTVQDIPELFPDSNTAVFISLLDGTKIHRKGQVTRVKDASVSFGTDFGMSVEASNKTSISSLESFQGGVISFREKSLNTIKIISDRDRFTERPIVTIKKKLAPNFDWSPSPPVHGSTWEQTVQIEHLSIEVSFIAYSSSGELKKVDLRAYLGALTEDQKKELGEIEKLIGVECNANTSLILSKSEEKVLRCICLIKDSDTAEAKNQKLLKLRTELEQKLYNYEIDTSSTYSNQNRVARQSLKDHIRSLSEAIKANEIIQVVAKNELTTILHTQSHDKVAQVTDRPYP